MKYEDSLD